jgi:hypothetical protein
MKKLIATLFLLQLFFPSFSQLVIQMKRQGGVSVVPCKVNGLSLSFIFDTGASDVTISLTEASFMLKNGYLSKEDIIGSEKYLDATGTVSEGITINIREIDIEGLKLYNVKASIVKSMDAPLLLGQSALSKLGTVSLDLNKNQITILSASKLTNTEVKQSSDVIPNLATYKKGFVLLAKSLAAPTYNTDLISKYFTLNTIALPHVDSFWAVPSDAYEYFNASSHYYTFCDENESNNSANRDSSIRVGLKVLRSFSLNKGVNWSLLDTSTIIIKPYSDEEIVFSFNCGNRSYSFVTKIANTFPDSTKAIKLDLPVRIDSKTFFEFREAIYKKFLSKIEEIKNSKDQNIELSYFYDDLIYEFESSYNGLPILDKQKFSSLYFEPVMWCERSANLKSILLVEDEETTLKRLRLFTKGINLYEENTYPHTKKNYEYLFLYSYRGECKNKMEDYQGAYEDYKKVITTYEKIPESKSFLKYSITQFYFNFSRICGLLEKYDESKSSIDKGINTYFKGLENYYPTWFELYTLRGQLNFFIYKNKQQACKDWSRAGELGDKDAFDYIKQYCNK